MGDIKDLKGKNYIVVIINVIVIVLAIIGITFAFSHLMGNIFVNTAYMDVVYNETSNNSNAVELLPISDSDITTKTGNVLTIVFNVKGASNNNATKNIIYDVSLANIDTSDSLLSEYTKWQLYKGSTLISSGSLSPYFDTIIDNRLVLTTIQQDMPDNNATPDSYTFKLWLSESCSGTLTSCTNAVNQSNMVNKDFNANISIDTYTGTKKAITRKTIATNLIKVLSAMDDGTNNLITTGGVYAVEREATGNQTYATTEYRYYGANPNNYVTFNGETAGWRIIGSFEVETPIYNGDTFTGNYTKEYRIKLIRAESIGKYSLDTSASTVNSGCGINEWSQADLMKLLNPGYDTNQDLDSSSNTITVNNSLYWNKSSGTCYNGLSNASTTCDFTSIGLTETAKGMIDRTKYYTGGVNFIITPAEAYSAERGNTFIESPDDGITITRYPIWNGYVGLAYPTDFQYSSSSYGASIGSNDIANAWMLSNVAVIDYHGITCNDSIWSITPCSYHHSGNHDMHALASINASLSKADFLVLPTVYLKSNVLFINGTGNISDPYIIG